MDLAVNAIPPLSPVEKEFLKQEQYPFPLKVVPTLKKIGENGVIRHLLLVLVGRCGPGAAVSTHVRLACVQLRT